MPVTRMGSYAFSLGFPKQGATQPQSYVEPVALPRFASYPARHSDPGTCFSGKSPLVNDKTAGVDVPLHHAERPARALLFTLQGLREVLY